MVVNASNREKIVGISHSDREQTDRRCVCGDVTVETAMIAVQGRWRLDC